MKKKIFALLVSLVLVVSTLTISTFASLANTSGTYWLWLYERRNPIELVNVLDPAYDVDKTPDIYFMLDGNNLVTPSAPNILLTNACGYIKLNYYNYITQQYGVHTVPVADVIGLATYDYRGETVPDNYDWFVRYRQYANKANTNFEYDRENGYFVSSYYPHLRVQSIEFYIYLNAYSVSGLDGFDMKLNQQLFNTYGIYPEYPYISGTYFDGNEYQNGYDTGYTDGFLNGELSGYRDGYDDGVDAGILEGENNATAWMNFKNLIFAIFDAPFYVLSTALNFEVFGINIAGTIIGIITLGLMAWVLKVIVVRLF